MAPKLKLQIPPFHLSTLNPEAKLQVPLTLTRAHRSHNRSELQQKLSVIIKRVIGEDTSYSPPSLSSSSSSLSPLSSPSSFSSSSSLSLSSLDKPPPQDDDTHSNYGDEDTTLQDSNPTNPSEPTESTPSISSPSSYASLASLNPYVLEAGDLARQLSLISSGPSARENRHDQDRARLARQLDRAHASVKAEERSALRVLRRKTRID
ncbi:hypothetical protein F4782DRAFT_548617 [Xylaria castorea]|nr:hypothetical protein F4782DRAFT_548617 [Xylaria castorea]